MSEEGRSAKPRRKAGDRGLFERPKGSGVWWIRYHDENGREHREKVGAKGLARKLYQKRKTEIQERRYFPEQIRRRSILVTDYLKQYLREHVEGRLKNAPHCRRYADLWTEALRGKALREVVPSDLARYVARRRNEDGMAPATVNRELAFLKRAYNVAIEDGLAEVNPVRSIKFFKENNQRVRYLTEDEEARLREEVGEEHWPKLAVALHTGLRRSNQFQLRWSDVDFDTGVITVRRAKSGESYHVPMNDELREILRGLPSRLRSEWVFPSETGETPLDSQNFVNRVFLPALKRANIEDFHWHDGRHTFASRLAMAGVDLRTIQELMGHKTMAMTLRYAHLSPAHKLEAVQRLMCRATGTSTGTSESDAVTASKPSPQVVEVERKVGGDART